jgi:pyruvate dehydrogenase E2 component (dihydrolipoamide acetyltransferase)
LLVVRLFVSRPQKTTDSVRTVGAPDFEFSRLDMPALSSTMKEGKVVSWLKSEGDAVEAGEAIMVVESDKADMDVEAFEDGFIAAIITGEGEAALVGAPVALIAASEADIPALKAYAAALAGGGAAPPASTASAAPAAVAAAPVAAAAPGAASAAPAGGRVVASPLAKTMAADMGVDISAVVGTGPEGRITAADVQNAALSPAAPKAAASSSSSPPPMAAAWTPAAGVVAATPTARALAKKAKLDLSKIVGTGEFGRVTADDVKMATGEMKPPKKAVASGAPAPVEMPEGLVPFTGMQRAVSNNMEKTLDIPVFRASREIEMDAFNELYQQVKPKGVTVSALLAKAVAKALEKHPVVNSSYRKEGTFFNKDINIAMAVAIDGGLITPVLKNANERGVLDLGEDWKVSFQRRRGLFPLFHPSPLD